MVVGLGSCMIASFSTSTAFVSPSSIDIRLSSVFDGDRSVISDKSEVADEILPPCNVVTVAERSEHPWRG